MPSLDLRADGDSAYLADVVPDRAEGGEPRRLRVVVPADLLAEFGLTPSDEPVLARDALDILVRRDVWRQVPDEVSLSDVEALSPGFTDELRVASAR